MLMSFQAHHYSKVKFQLTPQYHSLIYPKINPNFPPNNPHTSFQWLTVSPVPHIDTSNHFIFFIHYTFQHLFHHSLHCFSFYKTAGAIALEALVHHGY
ncbi:hypothetical protein QVD17_31575 [Tagetes erecta]|uniref:Uncharacterized protein n=1 Tax=Tagetes erecta TaxID=13708 RepID=A0AAD8NPG2_TARER|nr:hypothetical protein QVD17_31575 [Tagetes erecta]